MERSEMLVFLCFLSFLFGQSAATCDVEDRSGGVGLRVTGEERSLVFEMMLKDPNETFYREENLKGDAVNYDSTNSTYQGGCQNVAGGVRSLEISDSCVRVYKGNHCNGMSRALYRKSYWDCSINFLTPELPQVYSVGPCLPLEFEHANLYRGFDKVVFTTRQRTYWVNKDVSNIRHIPDFVDFGGRDTYAAGPVLSKG